MCIVTKAPHGGGGKNLLKLRKFFRIKQKFRQRKGIGKEPKKVKTENKKIYKGGKREKLKIRGKSP